MNRPEIVIQNPNRYRDFGAHRLSPWLALLVGAIAPQAASLGVRLASDREMERVNLQYRGKESTTDVLSFPGDLASAAAVAPVAAALGEEALGHLGDILISIPTARRQAAAAGHGLERELRLLLLHGVLHCLGYDHETDDGEMERRELRLRARWVPAEAAPAASAAARAAP